ncbi:MAG: hypothetical protein ACE369_19745 [Roseovarius sp.]
MSLWHCPESGGHIIVSGFAACGRNAHHRRFSQAAANELQISTGASPGKSFHLKDHVLVRDRGARADFSREQAEMGRLRAPQPENPQRLDPGRRKLCHSDKHVGTAYLLKEFNSWIPTSPIRS